MDSMSDVARQPIIEAHLEERDATILRRRSRDSRRMSSDGRFSLIMPELATLRRELNSRDSSIDTLKRSLSALDSKNQDLSQTICQKVSEIKFLGEKLHVAEAAAMDAVRDVCKEREQAEKVAADYRQQYQVSQTKLKREIDKYHKLHKNWESGKRTWAEEKKSMLENQRDTGVKLLTVLEEFLNAQQILDHDTSVGKETYRRRFGEAKSLSSSQPLEAQSSPQDGSLKEAACENDEVQSTSIRVNNTNSGQPSAANTSLKRLSVNDNNGPHQALPSAKPGTAASKNDTISLPHDPSEQQQQQQQRELKSARSRSGDSRGRSRKRHSQRPTSSQHVSTKPSEPRHEGDVTAHSVNEYIDETCINIPSFRSRSQKSTSRVRGAAKAKKRNLQRSHGTSQISLDRAYIDTCLGFYTAGMVEGSFHGRYRRPGTPQRTRTPKTYSTPESARLSTAHSKPRSIPRTLYIPPRFSSVNFDQYNNSRSRGNMHSAHDSYSTQRSVINGPRYAMSSADIPPVPNLPDWKYSSKNSPYAREGEAFSAAQDMSDGKFKRFRKFLEIFSRKRVTS